MDQQQTRDQLHHVDLLQCVHLKEPTLLLPQWLVGLEMKSFQPKTSSWSDTSIRTFHVFLSQVCSDFWVSEL